LKKIERTSHPKGGKKRKREVKHEGAKGRG